jgi:hypothetical protein
VPNWYIVVINQDVSVAVRLESPPGSPDKLVASLNLRGENSDKRTPVATIEGEVDSPHWRLLSAVYEEAQRVAFSSDDRLKKLDELLKSNQQLGE